MPTNASSLYCAHHFASLGWVLWDDGEQRPIFESMVDDLGLGLAITVHKAQGSQDGGRATSRACNVGLDSLMRQCGCWYRYRWRPVNRPQCSGVWAAGPMYASEIAPCLHRFAPLSLEFAPYDFAPWQTFLFYSWVFGTLSSQFKT
jgi:hypothetical protein